MRPVYSVNIDERNMKTWWLMCAVCAAGLGYVAGLCPPLMADADRRNCWPWPDANQADCEAYDCVWCPSGVEGVPWCFYNDDSCPSNLPETSRADCHPEPGSGKDVCTSRGCVYCPTASVGVPWCFYDNTISQGGDRCPSPPIPDNDKVDCYPTTGETVEQCLARDCYWCASAGQNVPWCFTPPSHGYNMPGSPTSTIKGYQVDIVHKNFNSWYGGDIQNARVEAEFHDSNRLRVKLFDPNNAQWEVPVNIPSPNSKAPSPQYDIQFINAPAFHFKVTRVSTGETIFNTVLGGLILAEQANQIAAKLPTSNVYGFGETEHHSYRHDMNWRTWGQFARDQPVSQYNLYGVEPFFMGLDSQNNAYGVLILNSNAQEVSLTPAPGVIFRSNGGLLDLYFFMGPTPEDVVMQYTEAVGRPYMPPYWALGFQIARYGYDDLNTMKGAVNRLRQYNIPHDVQYCDIDCFFENMDFTYNKESYAGLPEYVMQLKTEGTRFIVILDPCIAKELPVGFQDPTYPPLTQGNIMDVWVKDASNSAPAIGRVWPPVDVYFPDYTKPSTHTYWSNMCQDYHAVLEFDGLWIDMNEPASFVSGSPTGCAYNRWNNPTFKPLSVLGNDLYDKTVCMDYWQVMGRHYDVHSLYGYSEAEPSLVAARASTGGKRSIVISRSTFPGAGQYTGHWLGDNHAQWSNMHYSIIGMMEFNIFGMPYVGADICGFSGDTTESLCQRWMELGAFYPFSRNHNGKGWRDHDPGQWPAVGVTSREVLHIRYTLLPYLYTLFFEANTQGRTVIRPLLHEFTSDITTHGMDTQFLWGPALLIIPVLTQFDTTVNGYFPDARWYAWGDGREAAARIGYSQISAPMNFIPLYVRGGYVLPTQDPANSTVFSRQNPMGLVAAYDDNDAASGSLFWDEGDTVDTYNLGQYFLGQYTVTQGRLTGTVTNDGYAPTGDLHFSHVRVLGEQRAITSVRVDGFAHASFIHSADTKELQISALSLRVNTPFTITWTV